MSHQSSAAPAAVQNGSAEKKRSCCADLPWETCLRALGGVLGLLVIALGFVSLITGSFNPKNIVNSIYRVLFGVLIVLAEMRRHSWLALFSFLNSFFGLGLFYVFVGGLALGGVWYEYVLAIAFFAIGFFYINAGCCAGRSMYDPAQLQQDAIPLKPVMITVAAAPTDREMAPMVQAGSNDIAKESNWPEQ